MAVEETKYGHDGAEEDEQDVGALPVFEHHHGMYGLEIQSQFHAWP